MPDSNGNLRGISLSGRAGEAWERIFGEKSNDPELRRAILQHVAHRAAEDTDARDGWCRWSTSDRWPWEWDDYKPLVTDGLLERCETWKDVLLRLTEAGWLALHAAPATELPEPHSNVRGQPFEGDVLPGSPEMLTTDEIRRRYDRLLVKNGLPSVYDIE